MIKVLVVNDCAYVMADLIPYLMGTFDIKFIQRSRNWFAKTFGLATKILFNNADVYHASYALQDAFLLQQMKRLDVLHVHGSDVRDTIHNKNLGWIVKHNLLNAKKVLYSTPDLKKIVCDIRPDAEYFPTPIDTLRFSAKKEYWEYPRAVYFHKPYENPNKEIVRLLGEAGIRFYPVTKPVKYQDMPTMLRAFDIFIDQTTHSALSKTCLEAMSCGLATINFSDLDHLEEKIELLKDGETVKKLGKSNMNFVYAKHNIIDRVQRLKEIWTEIEESNK